jgi:hypothetical protein
MAMVSVQIEKVPQILLDAAAAPEYKPGRCHGLTVTPHHRGPVFRGLRVVRVYVLEGLSKEKTNKIIAHELTHVFQYLCGSSLNEAGADALIDAMTTGLIPKRKKKKNPW